MLARSRRGAPVRYKVGAEQLQQVPSLIHRPDTVFQAARTAPVGPTRAVSAATGAVACGIKADRLQVLDQDWETDCFKWRRSQSRAERWFCEPVKSIENRTDGEWCELRVEEDQWA
jgi:hypothetical protein